MKSIKLNIIILTCFVLATLFFAGYAFAVGKGAGLPGYIGAKACGECHSEEYNMWKLTPHANMLVDAKKNPDRIIANYFPENFPFSKENIFYTLGSHWLQKYLMGRYISSQTYGTFLKASGSLTVYLTGRTSRMLYSAMAVIRLDLMRRRRHFLKRVSVAKHVTVRARNMQRRRTQKR